MVNNMKTAIELLRVELILNSKQKHTESGKTSFTIGLSKFDELFKEAEKNHKQEIIDAFRIGDNSDCTPEQNAYEFAEQYYHDNFSINN